MSLLLMACGLGAALAAGLWHHGQIRAQRDATHRYFQLSQQAVEVLLTEVAEEQLASTPHAEEKRRVILESALEFYQKLYAEHLQNPLMQADLAEAQIRLGDVERWLGRYDESAASYEQVIQRLKQALVQHRDEASLRHHLAEALNGMAELYRTTSRNQQAIEAYQQAIHINAELRLLYPQNVVYSADLARCHYSLALCLQHSGRPQEARGQLDTAIELLEQIVDTPERADRRFVQDLARAHLNLGVVLRHLQEHDKVESTYGRAIALYAQLSQRHPHQTDYRFEQALAINNLGNHLAARSRRSEALQQHRQARDILQGLTNDYSGVVEYRRELANSLNSLAHVHAAGGDQPAAAEHLQEAESHLRRLATHFDERPDIAGDLGLTLGNLAAAQLAQSDAEAAHRSLEEALVHLNAIRARSPDHPDYVAASQYALGNLAQAQFDLGKWTEIGELAERLAAAAGDSKGDALTALAYFGRLVALLEAETEEPLDGPPAELRIASRRQAAAVTRDALEQGFVTDDDLRRDPRYAPLLPLVLDSGSAADSR